MKNDKIIDSWNKIEPSDSVKNRMLTAIIERNHFARKGNGEVNAMRSTISPKKLLPFTATCFITIVVLTVIMAGYFGWFGTTNNAK